MLAALEEGKKRLRQASDRDGGQAQAVPSESARLEILGEDLGADEQQRIRNDFFAAGLENWLPLLGALSFPSASLPLARDTCAAIVARTSSGESDVVEQCRCSLEESIDAELASQGWGEVFVKLSTRSPKDAPGILQKAKEGFHAAGGLDLPTIHERAKLFSTLTQQSFSVTNGREAVELLMTSDRVREDLEYALEAPEYDHLGVHIVLRRWDGPIPIEHEFRGIMWDGQLNALAQYYHALYFPELEAQREAILGDIQATFAELQPRLVEAGFTHCIVDFAWLGPQNLKVIELNPFDGVALGCFPGSTGLFRWDDPEDRRIIKEGPFEMRLRQAPLSDAEMRSKLNTSWRDIIAPPRRGGKGAGKSKAPAPQEHAGADAETATPSPNQS